MDFAEVLKPEVVWFIIGLIFILLELVMPGLIIFFFGFGAWVVALCSLFVDFNFNTQIIIFIVASVAALVVLRKYLMHTFFQGMNNQVDTLEEEFIGKTATVEAEIKDGRQGKVAFKGTSWNAKSEHDIDEGALVKIIAKESIVLKVEPLK